jgi:hypothetical protein
MALLNSYLFLDGFSNGSSEPKSIFMIGFSLNALVHVITRQYNSYISMKLKLPHLSQIKKSLEKAHKTTGELSRGLSSTLNNMFWFYFILVPNYYLF